MKLALAFASSLFAFTEADTLAKVTQQAYFDVEIDG